MLEEVLHRQGLPMQTQRADPHRLRIREANLQHSKEVAPTQLPNTKARTEPIRQVIITRERPQGRRIITAEQRQVRIALVQVLQKAAHNRLRL